MNQHQRKFLIDEIDNQYRREMDGHRKRKPMAPSLSNYLTAAILDGTAVIHPIEQVRETVRQRVRDLNKGEALLGSGERSWRRRDEDEANVETITIPALLLFDEPPEYAELRRKYEADLAEWESAGEVLEKSYGAMKIKVQVGSDKGLETLVDQADKICTLSLAESSRLLLGTKGTDK